jgi:CIC family chloride channel protein
LWNDILSNSVDAKSFRGWHLELVKLRSYEVSTEMKYKMPYRFGLVLLSLLAVLVGIIAGFGAVFFRDLIGLIHNIAFLGQFSIEYDANQFTPPSPWGPLIIVVPVLGSFIVTYLVETYAREARGHGVPEVIDAIYYREGMIRPVVGVVKSLASAISIGTGGAVGREGPIAQIGASFGSLLGQIIEMAPWQRVTLVAAGAGAGIAATFNTPIGGVMFAVELMMPELSARTFLPVALATGTATFIGRIFFGIHPAFVVPTPVVLEGPATLAALLTYALLGMLMGLAATIFIRGLYHAEQLYERIGNPYARHALGMLVLGLLIYLMLSKRGHYYVEGVGYATIQAILVGDLSAPTLLLLLFVAKLYGTWTTLGSGGSGGIFSPSLFMGATMGAAFGMFVTAILPVSGVKADACAIIGMAALVGGGTGAAMTAVTMIFEMTRDYDVVMPSIIAVALAIGTRRLLSPESIYTIKLVNRGHFVPEALHANLFLVRRAKDVMEREVILLPSETRFDAMLRQSELRGGLKQVVVTRGNYIVGFINVDTGLHQGLKECYTGILIREVAQHNFIIAQENDVVFNVITRMARRGANIAIVIKGHGRPYASRVVGIISKEHIADYVAASIGPYE